MDTKKNAPQERGAKVIRSSGKPAAHYKPSHRRISLQGYRVALAELEYDKHQFAHMAYGVSPGSHEALKALAEVHRQIVTLREQLL